MSFQSSTESLNFTNAVWDDGEWISWAEINRYVEAEAAEGNEGDWDVLEEDEEWIEYDEPPKCELSLEREPSPEDESSPEKCEPSPEILDELMKLLRQAQASLERCENIGHQIGEMGELFAEAKFGIKRHRRYAQGSDGKIGNDFVEVKTISPWKKKHMVTVKRAGHWSRLVVVRISAPWIFEAKIFDRKQLRRGNGGKHAKVSWNAGKQMVIEQRDKEKVQPALYAKC
jgi:hypothetical protein